MFRVGTTENNFTAVGSARVTVQIERENRLGNQSLVVHVVERRRHSVHGNGTVSQSQDAIEFGSDEN